MLQALMNLLSLCLKPFGHGRSSSSSDSKLESFVGVSKEGKDGLLWYRDVGRYWPGEFSMAVVQANQVIEDQSQIESGPFGTFVGVYDGHGGPEAARFVCDHLFRHFQAISAETHGVVTSETIQRAICATEEGFTNLVSELWSTRPQMATVGSCCLVGVIYQQTLFVANLGDSRVVLGKKVGSTGGIAAIQLSTEHNANLEAIRHELKNEHPNDPQIVVLKHGVWRVKGIIQVSRSIGDVYMKHARFNREPINAKFRLPEPMDKSILSANPTIISHPLHPNDSFLVFASDGLWEHLSNEKVVDIVHSNPCAGSAKRLVKAALQEAARKREMRYSDLQKIDKKAGQPELIALEKASKQNKVRMEYGNKEIDLDNDLDRIRNSYFTAKSCFFGVFDAQYRMNFYQSCMRTIAAEYLKAPLGEPVKGKNKTRTKLWLEKFYQKTTNLPEPFPHELAERLEKYLDTCTYGGILLAGLFVYFVVIFFSNPVR
ncbi:hypothetical protein NC653_020894 [Populus alba x Populus x berolinensis]|uniref:protein-serine/threonine phosphatase n=1 Tax=Populus alba x Populus x berolinensis TaxID=444605 RepID=A0AAD6QD02_9ROSI|nr:hypothetical protein NC653_020894 [Populus alba x Populus x berolinensis]